MSKKKHHHEEHIDETWLIPYADMLTLLLALFIVLFAMSQVDTKKFEMVKKALETVFKGGTGVMENSSSTPTDGSSDTEQDMRIIEALQEAKELKELKENLDKYIAEQGLTKQVETKIASEGLQISFHDAALFASGKADLRPEAFRVLDTISRLLESQTNEIRIAGHTDNLPIHTAEFPSNWDLSAKRSLNVMKHILNNKNLDPSRFTAVGYGEYRPKEPNTTEEGRAQNRRVEVLIIRKYPEPPKTQQGQQIQPIKPIKPAQPTAGPTVMEAPLKFVDTKP